MAPRVFTLEDATMGSTTVHHEVKERIDNRTFYALARSERMDLKKEVTIQFYEDMTEATYVSNLVTTVGSENIIRLFHVDFRDGYVIIIFERFYDNIRSWEKWKKPIWLYDDKKTNIISMDCAFTTAFSGIVNGLRSMHSMGLYHGNVTNGVTISDEHQAKLVNFAKCGDLETGILKDLDDLKALVRRVAGKSKKIPELPDPVVLELFYNLQDLFENRLTMDTYLKEYAFFVYNNPVFFDDSGKRRMFIEKLWEVRRMNKKTFEKEMLLSDERTEVKKWGKKVLQCPYLANVLRYGRSVLPGKVPSDYQSNSSVIEFYRHAFHHYDEAVERVETDINGTDYTGPMPQERETDLKLLTVLPDVIPKIYYEFVKKFGSVTRVYENQNLLELLKSGAHGFPGKAHGEELESNISQGTTETLVRNI